METATTNYYMETVSVPLDNLLSVNKSNFTYYELKLFIEENKQCINHLLDTAKTGTFSHGKYIVHVDARRGQGTKLYIINNALGYINPKGFSSQSLRPFSSSTINGLNYLEVSQDTGGRAKIILISYSLSRNVKMRDTTLGDYPLSYGDGYHHIQDVFNIMHNKTFDADDYSFKTITEDDVVTEDPDTLLANIVRASVYMLTSQLQTCNRSDSTFLNIEKFSDDNKAIHRRANAFYAGNPNDDTVMFVNFRNQLTFKDREQGWSTTACNNLGACFSIDESSKGKDRIEKLKYIGVHSSIGHTVEF